MHHATVSLPTGADARASAAAPWPGRRRILDVGLFCFLMAVIAVKELSDLDATWDSLNYHLPFAARRLGLISAAQYRFDTWLEDCYRGIPALPYYLYGQLWRASRDINAANLVSGFAFAGYCFLLARMFAAPLIVAAVAIAAIPVIQVNLPSVYTDLVTNLAFAAALLITAAALVEHTRPLTPRLTAAVFCAALAANFKLQFIPLAGAFVGALAVALITLREGDRRVVSLVRDELKLKPAWIAALGAGVLLCFAPAIKNLVLYGNPIFPVGLQVMGVQILPGATAGELYNDPVYLRGAPQPLRWLLSVIEYQAYGFRPRPYILGQGSVPPDAPSLRMGGYLGLFVLYNLGVFLWCALRQGAAHKGLVTAFGILTLIVACLPASHELRYYAFWMILLVSLNIAFLWKWRPTSDGRAHFAFTAVAAFLFVGSITSWAAFVPSHLPIKRYIANLGFDRAFTAQIKDGETYCLVHWQFRPLLATSLFHRGHTYAVVEADGDRCPPGVTRIDYDLLTAPAHAQP